MQEVLLTQRREQLILHLAAGDSWVAKIVPVKDEAGAGSLAGVEFDGFALAVKVPGLSEVKGEDMLHKRGVPVVCRVNKDGLIFSTRTLFEQNYEEIGKAIADLYDYAERNGLC